MKRTLLFNLLLAGLLLACNGAFAQTWEERIVNGDFEGTDYSSFSVYVNNEDSLVFESNDIVVDDDDASNHCARISFTANPWTTEFIIKLTEPLSEGDMIQFSMRAKTSSSKDASLSSDELTQFIVKGGGEWNTCAYSGTVSARKNGCQAITLRFNRTSSNSDIFHFDDISLKVMKDAPIEFADAKVKETCVALWDTNRDGELSLYEAAAVTDLYDYIWSEDITSFDELQYFVGLESIHGFAHCINLTSVVLPNSVKTIADEAFSGCTSLASIVIPNSVELIRGEAFKDCSSLTSIELPNSLLELYNTPFSGCSSLTSLIIPKSVKRINTNPVARCSSLISLTVEEGNTRYDCRENCNAIIDTYSNKLIAGCKNTIIPNSVTSIGAGAFSGCGLTAITIPNSVTNIGEGAFGSCSGLTAISIPNSVTTIDSRAFMDCSGLTSVSIPNSVTSIGVEAFYRCTGLEEVISHIEEPFEISKDVFGWYETDEGWVEATVEFTSATLYVPKGCKARYEATEGWKEFNEIVEMQDDYRPFVEDGKVWKVGTSTTISDNSVQVVDYYYFDGDTIVGGKTCKQMMCQRFVSPDYSNEYWMPRPSLSKVGAWYEEDQKVYFYDERKQAMVTKYDFSLNANDTLRFLTDWSSPFIIGPKQTGGLEGFKGAYRDIRMCGDEGQSYHSTFWLEGVGDIQGPIRNPCNPILADPVPEFLMSCAVGDEVIYLNDQYEDGATPDGARKNHFDFTHTVKTQPKAPKRGGEELLIYGEYNAKRLGINLDLLDEVYLVSITDENGKAVYEKAVNAGTIVALDIDISAYAEGRYTVTVENSHESFTGQFETVTTGIEGNAKIKELKNVSIYNLQGQRLTSLQKGLNIVDGRKVWVR